MSSFVAQPYHIATPGNMIAEEIRENLGDDWRGNPTIVTDANLSNLSETEIETIEQCLVDQFQTDISGSYGGTVREHEMVIHIDKASNTVEVVSNEFTTPYDNHEPF